MSTGDSMEDNTGSSTSPVDTPPTDEKSGVAKGLIIAVAVLVVAALIGVAFAVIGGGTAQAQVTLRPLGSPGDDPFGPSIAAAPSATLSDFANSGAGGGLIANSRATAISGSANLSDYRTVTGNVPGVFGGTLDERTCDVDQLVQFLSSDESKAQAWSNVLGTDVVDLAAYANGLTAANLAADTRVLSHGFAAGEVVARETVLQRGSAVLIDARGVPRVDCYSGNPLRNPTIQADETFVGDRWPNFTESTVIVVEPAPTNVAEFVLVDVNDGGEFVRPVGSTGENDTEPQSAAAATEAEPAEEASADPPAPNPTATPAPITRELNIVGLIDVNTPISGEISNEDDELIFEFDAAPGAKLQLAITNDRASVGTIAAELSTQGDTLDFFRIPAGGSESVELTLDHESGGRYEVIISEGPGAFDFVVGSVAQDDAGQGRDAGEGFDDALEIEAGETVAGHLAGLDRSDAYVVVLEDAPSLVMTARADRDGRTPAFELELLGENIQFFRVNPADESTFELLMGPDDDGLLELYVTEGPSDYDFTIELVPQNDANSGGDAPAELQDALVVDDVNDISGEVGQRDTADYFLFPAPSDEFTLSIEVATDADSGLGVDLLGPDGTRVGFFRVQPGATGTISVAEPDTAGETYRLVLSEGRGRYIVSSESVSLEP